MLFLCVIIFAAREVSFTGKGGGEYEARGKIAMFEEIGKTLTMREVKNQIGYRSW